MGSKNKLKRFAENETFDNLFQLSYEQLYQEDFHLKGKWNKEFFKNENPIVLELGCGKGEYTIGLARHKPNYNFIGVDIKGARLWRGLKTAHEQNMKNVAFLRTRIELINNYFSENEVSEIWITFPDPQPRNSREKKRLTSPRFLERYRHFLKKDGVIHLKTDSDLLYQYTMESLEAHSNPIAYHIDDLYAVAEEMEVKKIRTFYEQIWLAQGLKIKYIRFGLKDE
ncbi:MAG: tRNA (guanosine(46)-N7)-methyltransferase TrmB [Bacteroidales bacterium]|nr:tRNA (guanosine(46)-N7)-methyltransferase TrmB [Bacteroidales bacterium]